MSSHACVSMNPCGAQPPELHGGSSTLPCTYVVPSTCHHANSVDHPLSGRSLGRGQEAQVGYGLSDDSAKYQWWGWPIFRLAVVWAHPHQGCLSTLVEAAWILMLLADDGPDWPYAFVCMSDTMLHVPLFDNRHISTMMDGVHSVNACGWLSQLQLWKLLQHGDSIVFWEGRNGEPKALQFSFWDLPLWNATSANGPTWDLPMIEVVLSCLKYETVSLTQVPPPSGHQSSMWHHHSSEPTPPGDLGTAPLDFSHNLSPHLPV